MGITITCEKCKKTYRYISWEMHNIGTSWHPIWVVKCYNCGTQIKCDEYNLDFFDGYPPPKNKNAYERAESGDIKEYWIQEYVKDNYKKLGFSEIEGPFEVGLDFKGTYKSKKL